MVKIKNIYGDIKKGKQAGAVYQTLYGRQIRRLTGGTPAGASPLQENIRQNFRDAVTWLQSLSLSEVEDLKAEWRDSKNRDPAGTPINWWNFGKQKYMELIYNPLPEPEPLDLEYFDINYFDENIFR